jgi:hypothetical protein
MLVIFYMLSEGICRTDSLCRHVRTFRCACRTQWIQRVMVHLYFSVLDPVLLHYSHQASLHSVFS